MSLSKVVHYIGPGDKRTACGIDAWENAVKATTEHDRVTCVRCNRKKDGGK